jgi:hypothetical protein
VPVRLRLFGQDENIPGKDGNTADGVFQQIPVSPSDEGLVDAETPAPSTGEYAGDYVRSSEYVFFHTCAASCFRLSKYIDSTERGKAA